MVVLVAWLVRLAWLAACEGWSRLHRDVRTQHGVVRGYYEQKPPHFVFLGIPYARTTRQQRFKAPGPPRFWDGIFEATHQVRCPQPDGSGTEDCLVVNVFKPEHATPAQLPVLVLVHGGSFQEGWGSVRPPTRLLEEDLVIVTFNYRVGFFGFLCMGIAEAPGNAGLKDQVAALYWVNKNIVNFGGNPLDVTVYGIGSGAAAVHLLLLSGVTRGLLYKVILESGSALSPLSLSYEPMLTAMEVAAGLGYRGKEAALDLAIFYKQLPSNRLLNISSLFLPCLENNLPTTYSLLETDPLETLKDGNYHKVPMIVAYKNTGIAMPIELKLQKFYVVPESFEHMLPNNLEFADDSTKKNVADLIKKFYLEKNTRSENILENYIDYINDVTYEYPIIKSSSLHASTSVPIYLMKFVIQKYSKSVVNNSTQVSNDIVDYFYDYEHINKEDGPKTEILTLLWRNFIKLG